MYIVEKEIFLHSKLKLSEWQFLDKIIIKESLLGYLAVRTTYSVGMGRCQYKYCEYYNVLRASTLPERNIFDDMVHSQRFFTQQNILRYLVNVVIAVPLDVRVDNGDHLPPLGSQLVLHSLRGGELGRVPREVSVERGEHQSARSDT